MCKTFGRIRIRIWIGIKMASRIRIRIAIMIQIHNTAHKEELNVLSGVKVLSQECWRLLPEKYFAVFEAKFLNFVNLDLVPGTCVLKKISGSGYNDSIVTFLLP
jgi:hypothetical protein